MEVASSLATAMVAPAIDSPQIWCCRYTIIAVPLRYTRDRPDAAGSTIGRAPAAP